jgi:hypothetical protein
MVAPEPYRPASGFSRVQTGQEIGNLFLTFAAASALVVRGCFLSGGVVVLAQAAYTAAVAIEDKRRSASARGTSSYSYTELCLLNVVFEAKLHAFMLALSGAVGLEAGLLGYAERLQREPNAELFVGPLGQTGLAFAGFCVFYMSLEHGVALLQRMQSTNNWFATRNAAAAVGIGAVQVVAALQLRRDVTEASFATGWVITGCRAGLGVLCAALQLWVSGLTNPRGGLLTAAPWVTAAVATAGLAHSAATPGVPTRLSHCMLDALTVCIAVFSSVLTTVYSRHDTKGATKRPRGTASRYTVAAQHSPLRNRGGVVTRL